MLFYKLQCHDQRKRCREENKEFRRDIELDETEIKIHQNPVLQRAPQKSFERYALRVIASSSPG